MIIIQAPIEVYNFLSAFPDSIYHDMANTAVSSDLKISKQI